MTTPRTLAKIRRTAALQNGVYSRVPLTDLPSPFKHVKRQVALFRRWVENELLERYGTISAYQAKRLHTACLAMRQLACIERLMLKCKPPPDGLSHERWMAYSDRVIRFSEAADRALKDLGLDADLRKSPWEVLDSTLATPAENTTTPPLAAESTAAQAQSTEDHEGREDPENRPENPVNPANEPLESDSRDLQDLQDARRENEVPSWTPTA
jgi:hypothetical protein